MKYYLATKKNEILVFIMKKASPQKTHVIGNTEYKSIIYVGEIDDLRFDYCLKPASIYWRNSRFFSPIVAICCGVYSMEC